jgi:predicted enzyme related to lactoylglutathione lyase
VRATAFYAQLLHWRAQVVRAAAGSYLAFDTGGSLDGGIVECGTGRPLWLPYVEVDRIWRSTERARELGAVAEAMTDERELLDAAVAGLPLERASERPQPYAE